MEIGSAEHVCSHHAYRGTTPIHGVSRGASICVKPLSSGWIPTCAHCKREIDFYFYTSEDAIQKVNTLAAGSFYYSKCVNKKADGSTTCNNMEQGIYVSHTCLDLSINRFYIHYDGNGATGGSMKDSMHYMDSVSPVTYEGTSVTNNLSLSTNGFSKKGYTFAGWATSPTGAVLANNNVSTALGNNKPSDGQIITVYAKWAANSSFGSLKVNPNGGAYYGDGSTRVVATGMKGQTYTVNESQIAPPAGYTVYFNTNGGHCDVSSIQSKNAFSHFTFTGKGKLNGNVYTFPSVTQNDTITFQYNRGFITLPTPYKAGCRFTGWYNSAGALVGYAGSTYTPQSDYTLFAGWENVGFTLGVSIESDDIGTVPNKPTYLKWNDIGDNYSYVEMCAKDWEAQLTMLNTPGITATVSQTWKSSGSAIDVDYTIPHTGYYAVTFAGAKKLSALFWQKIQEGFTTQNSKGGSNMQLRYKHIRKLI